MTDATDVPLEVTKLFEARLLGSTDAAARVSRNRADAVWAGELPALVIYSTSSPAAERTQAPRVYWEDTEVRVELFVAGTPDTGEVHDENLDRLAWQVKRLVLPLLAQLPQLLPEDATIDAARTTYNGTEKDYAADGSPLLGGARVTFTVSHLLQVDPLDPADCDQLRQVVIVADVQDPGTSTGADLPDQETHVDIAQD